MVLGKVRQPPAWGEKGGNGTASKQVSLLVNDVPIELDYFVQGFIDHTISGMLASLKDTRKIKSVDISIKGDKVTIILNDTLVPTNPFVSKITRNTIVAMVSSLKGVGEVNRVNVSLKR